MSLVSIIVPAYNAEQYIGRCIESVLKQDYDDFELIIVNDGSKDATAEICQGFSEKDPRIIVINKENGGVSEARNTGIERASGEYIMFADADDLLAEDMLSTTVKAMGDADLVMASIAMITKKGRADYIVKDTSFDLRSLMEDYSVEAFPRICLSSPCCKLYKKEIIDRFSIRFDKTMSLGEDTVFNMSYVSHCKKINAISKPLYFYIRVNEESLFSKFRDNRYNDVLKAFQATYGLAKSVNVSARADFVNRSTYVHNLVATLVFAVRTAEKSQCIRYMKNMAKNEVLKSNMNLLGKGSQKYLIALLVRSRMYYPVYLMLSLRYKKKK